MPLRIETINRETVLVTALTAPVLRWCVGPFRVQQGMTMPIEVRMNWEQEFDLGITPKTLGGADAPVDGPALWEVSAPGCTATSTSDLTCLVQGVRDAQPGDVVVTCTVDADLGEGTVHLVDTCIVHLESPMAGSLGMASSPVRQQSPAP
jgi:hypothetical protein